MGAGSRDFAPVRVELASAQGPHFIGCWSPFDGDYCDQLIEFFETNPQRHAPGLIGKGRFDESQKSRTDLSVDPKDLEQDSHQILHCYFDALQGCFRDYCSQWPFLENMSQKVRISSFNIGRYDIGGHFSGLHTERMGLSNAHRWLAWMTYLNSVEAGGETEFSHYGLSVAPVTGRTLIWPAEWTHAHRAHPTVSGRKYIITGWILFAAE